MYDKIEICLIKLRSNIYNQADCHDLMRSAKQLIDDCGNCDLSKILVAALNEAENLLAKNNFKQAYDLIDTVHALPAIINSAKKDMKAYWDNFIEVYHKKWQNDFFGIYKEMILSWA